jgi:hypothetical protein
VPVPPQGVEDPQQVQVEIIHLAHDHHSGNQLVA